MLVLCLDASLSKQLNHFICEFCRCIKPNPESRPGSLTPPYVLEQLRAGGVLEAVRIASAGFPTRKAFKSASYAIHGRNGYTFVKCSMQHKTHLL